jgi:uncharacterized lipoprotein YddW (UPF0748 family)
MNIIEVLIFALIFFFSLTKAVNKAQIVQEKIINSPETTLNIHQEEKTKPVGILTNTIPKEINNSSQIVTNFDKNNQIKPIVGIYLSRYHATRQASEQNIRQRVRYYYSQGFNTIIHGVAANGCTYYDSNVTKTRFGYTRCPEIHPNEFKAEWLNWLIDEAHQHGMEVHAYFEKGIKLDQRSPILQLAQNNNWVLPEIDQTYAGMDHYVLDVNIQEVAEYYIKLMKEFAQKYPLIDAIQWDDYVAYHTTTKSTPEQTAILTNFMQQMVQAVKTTTPAISFDISHHNPYWAGQYFAADWQKWGVDRAFIQGYNDKNFTPEMNYAEQFDGLGITDNQFHRLEEIVNNKKIRGILIFPLHNEKAKDTAAKFYQAIN